MFPLTQDEVQLKELCRDFAQKELAPFAHDHDKNETFNIKAFKQMGQLGILGLSAPIEYGGSGLGAFAATIAIEEISRVCASTALSFLAHSILCVNNIVHNASDSQKQTFLPKLVSGEHIGCMGMSEADFGSDALGMQTKASLEGTHYVINGSKMWITNAQVADVCYLYAKTGSQKKDISTFIVNIPTKGFEVGKKISKMGMKASPTGELLFNKVKLEQDCLVGQPNQSTYQMMKNLEIERITISGISLGLAKSCFQASLQYAKNRTQFGQNIGKFQLIQKMLAEMSAQIDMMECYLYQSARNYDMGARGPQEAAKIKLIIPQIVTQIALDAIQIHGGYGYASEFPVERYMRDAKLMEIGAGTNEIMINIIGNYLLQSSITI